jgi:hypothetical protein
MVVAAFLFFIGYIIAGEHGQSFNDFMDWKEK